MPAPAEPDSNSEPEARVTMSQVVRFVRQLAHDLRNHLNAAELQSAYLMEIAQDGELKEEIKRLRGMIAQVGGNLQSLTAALGQPRLTQMPYDAKDFIEDLRQRLATDYVDDSAKVEWHVAVSDATLNIDPQLLLPALLELFANAFRHERAEGVIVVAARSENGRFVFTLAEPKRDFQHSTEHWGQEPLHALGQGHYGLGLYRTRAIVEAHGGKFEAHHDKDTSSLITTVTLPVAATNG